MAKLELINNIFDLRDTDIFDGCEGRTVLDVITGETDRDMSCMAEAYNPDTGETYYCEILDDPGESLNLCVLVNGVQREPGYLIMPDDLVEVMVIPAKDAGHTWAVIGGIAAMIAGFALAIYTGGASLGLWAAGAKAGLLALGMVAGGGLIAGGAYGIYWGLQDPKEKDENTSYQQGSQASINGSGNSPLEGAFPLLIGRISVTPSIVGSVYNEFIYDDGDPETYFGKRQKATELLAIAYAPVYVEDIKFDELIAVRNKNHILSGLLSHETVTQGGVKYARNPYALEDEPITFNGEKSGYEVEAMWNVNKVRMELSQFGNHRTIYPNTVKQKNFSVPLLYCYDEEYREVAGDKCITWQGGSFPSGMRNAPIKFAEGVPYKISVGIDFPSGLYMSHSSESKNIFTKIPMNLIIQWRPVYRYAEKCEEDATQPSAADIYYPDRDTGDTYSELRYRGWRNFDSCSSPVVTKVTYTGGDRTWYTVYHANGVPAKQGGSYGYYRNSTGYSLEGTFHPIQAESDANYDEDSRVALYTSKFLDKTLSEAEVGKLRSFTTKEGKEYVYEEYMAGHPTQANNIAKAKAGTSFTYGNPSCGATSQQTYIAATCGTTSSTPAVTASCGNSGTGTNRTTVQLTYETYALWVLDNELSEGARSAIRDLARQSLSTEDRDALWCDSHANTSTVVSDGNISKREVALNKGLSENTSEQCNPNWEGGECWSFGAASCGHAVWMQYPGDPAMTESSITCSDSKKTAYSKNQMRFEVDAYLSREDILDLLDRNPKTKATGEANPMLGDDVKMSAASIEVRVLRLTPCYIEGSEKGKESSSISYSYSDIVKWSYLKSYCIDKQALLDDIDNLSEVVEVTNPGTKEKEKVSISRIDCNAKTYKSTEAHGDKPTWLSWDIDWYLGKPVSTEDQLKLALLAVEAEADALGQLSSSISKVNMTGYAITPTLLKDWTRYWYDDGKGGYWYCDYYDSSSNRDAGVHPWYVEGSYMWRKSDKATFDSEATTRMADGYLYTEMREAWDERMFPEKVEPQNVMQVKTDERGMVVKNDKGEAMTEMVRQGNDWIPYIANLMSEHQDSASRWVATDAFRAAFTNQNAIAQALGVLVGQSLGKDAYWYNSLADQRFVRLWQKTEGSRGTVYTIHDTDSPEYSESVLDVDERAWTGTTEDEWNAADRTEIGDGLSWSYRRPGSAFNMLTLREAYRYTDSISIGGSFKPLSYKCNMYVTQQQKVQQLLQTILTCGRAYWIYDELGRMDFRNDRERSTPVLMLTDENILSGSYTRSFEKGIAGYHGTFDDENNGFQQGEVYALREGQSRESHTRDIVDMTLTGVTNPDQMWALLAYMLGAMITRRESWELKLNHVGNALAVGSMVEFQNSVLEIGTDTSGRIAKAIEDDDYIYGFICDRTYEYRGEYDDDGRNVQGFSLFQAAARQSSKVVTMRFASESQQAEGITVGGSTYANLKGQTNLMLLEKRISKADGTVEGYDEETGGTVHTQHTPSEGDVIAFGNVGSITQRAIVYQLQYDEKGKATVSLYPYFDQLYRVGDSMPVYKTSMTKKSRVQEVSLSMEATRTDLLELKQNTSVEVQKLVEGNADVNAPNGIKNLKPVARRDEVSVSWDSPGTGLANTVEHYEVQFSKTGSFDGTFESMTVSTNACSYVFDRRTDGYPEAEDMETWRFRVRAKNIYGKVSEEWTEAPVNTDGYGTWRLTKPSVERKVVDRTVILTLSPSPRSDDREVYGNIQYKVRVRRGAFTYSMLRYLHKDSGVWYMLETHDKAVTQKVKFDGSWTATSKKDSDMENLGKFTNEDGLEVFYQSYEETMKADAAWLKPAQTLDPYADSDNYHEGDTVSQQKNFVKSGGTYTQTMPLHYSDSEADVYNLVNTPYYFDALCYNEAGDGEWYSGRGEWAAGHDGVQATALCTNIRDIVLANETAKESYVEKLSAISANLGEISQGSLNGDDNNYWTLSTKGNPDPDRERDWIGAFRIGGETQYLKVSPINMDASTRTVGGYAITLKAENINLTNSGMDFVSGTYIYSDDDRLRMKLTPNGIVVQKRTGSEWTAGNFADCGMVQVVVSEDAGVTHTSMLVTNDPAGAVFGVKFDATVYHFSGTVADESGADSKGLNLDPTKLESEGGYIQEMGGGYYDGTVSASGNVVALHRMDCVDVGDTRVWADGTSEEKPSKTYNDAATTDWGLTQAQIDSRIFK